MEDQRRRLMRKRGFSGRPDTSLEEMAGNGGYIDITTAPVEPLPSDVETMRRKILRVLKLEPPQNLRALLDCIDGRGYQEIADEENVPVGTIKSRLHHVHHRWDRLQPLIDEVAEYKDGEMKGITVLRDDIQNLIAAKSRCGAVAR